MKMMMITIIIIIIIIIITIIIILIIILIIIIKIGKVNERLKFLHRKIKYLTPIYVAYFATL